ncbi:MAG: hypothetical protein HQ547_07995 [Candidatus Omnitrophica bacterium]|nr:hypothetical protein [Candidatus Omnitrophota bacterium]
MEKNDLVNSPRKRSVGVTVFALTGMLFQILSWVVKDAPVRYSVITIALLFWAVLYYFLLRLKNWSRIVLLVSSILHITLHLITVSMIVIYRAEFPDLPASSWIFFYLSFIYPCAFIYYFTRRKVKALFKEEKK